MVLRVTILKIIEPVGAITRARKRSRPTLTAQKSMHTPSNEAALSTTNTVPIAPADKEAPQPKANLQAAESNTTGPGMDSENTIVVETQTASVPDPNIHRFQNGNILQGSLSLEHYAAACAHHVASIRAEGQSVDEPGPLEREAVKNFVIGMRKLKERVKLVEELEKQGLAVIDRQCNTVEFFCGWLAVKEALERWD